MEQFFTKLIDGLNMKYFALLTICFTLFSCSKFTDKEIMESGKKSISDGKYQQAIDQFKDLVDNYPESDLAKDAIFEIGKLYHGKALKDIPDKESLEMGITYYRKLVDSYPESEEAPKALFMIAYIQANELNQVESAKKTYRLFLDKYTDNSMAPSAKVELDNAGVDAEEFLKKQTEQKE